MKTNQSNTIFLTFGAGSKGWKDASSRISREANKLMLFDSIFNLDELWLKESDPEIFDLVYRFIKKGSTKGFGYYLWKTAILNWAETNFPGESFLYMDAGSHIQGGITEFTVKKLLSENNDLGLAWQLPNHPEVKWTKNELIQRMGCDARILESNQIQSGFIYLPKIDNRSNFIKLYRDLALENSGFFFSDELLSIQNPQFISHRHDQSVFSLLWKNFGFGYQIDKTFPENLGQFPIIAARNNTKVLATSHPWKLKIIKAIDFRIDKVNNFFTNLHRK